MLSTVAAAVPSTTLPRPPVSQCARQTRTQWDFLETEARKKLDMIKRKVEENAKTRRDGPDMWDHGKVKRDGYGHEKVVVRCKNSYTGLFSFLAVPLLMGNIMVNVMNMININ